MGIICGDETGDSGGLIIYIRRIKNNARLRYFLTIRAFIFYRTDIFPVNNVIGRKALAIITIKYPSIAVVASPQFFNKFSNFVIYCILKGIPVIILVYLIFIALFSGLMKCSSHNPHHAVRCR